MTAVTSVPGEITCHRLCVTASPEETHQASQAGDKVYHLLFSL